MRSLVFFALLVTGAFSKHIEGGVEDDDKIIDGFSCYKNTIPYQVSLRSDGRHFCGGALIAKQWVVTSAQCFKSNTQVVVGEHDLTAFESKEQSINVHKAIRHPAFNSQTLVNDIMLLKLTKEVTINAFVQTVTLPSYYAGSHVDCLVTGWGDTSATNADDPANILQCLDSPIIADNECSFYYPDRITNSMFCAGYVGYSSTCKGDEGGPLVCNGQLQGIVSWGDRCSAAKIPWVYTKVYNYLGWIQNTMKTK
ncbi:trypsin-like [Eleutherodactylus coqui]|uniref:trypsin-like n=1 Tax=Eleutherodactylus coqui TaxID=57060 RepID=UPI0034630DEF